MYHPRGFALIISVIITSVVLAVGIALIDIAYKQVLLSSSAKNSQVAFYNADSGLECALYWDQKFNAFDYNAPLPATSLSCDLQQISVNPPSSYSTNQSGGTRVTTFNIPCPGSGYSSTITIYKQNSGTTDLYSNGYSTCDSASPSRIERGLKANY
ncbi:MAG: seg [Parcubacteria group bacterium]|nr:seg [Parcubacteria group bacterium]